MDVFMAFAQKEANISFKMFLNPPNIKEEKHLLWSVWGSNSRPWRYQHHALPTELTDQLPLHMCQNKVQIILSLL